MKTALLLSKIDQEDLWVSGFVFAVENSKSYADSFNEIKDKLRAPEFEQALINEFVLDDESFGLGDTLKLTNVVWTGADVRFEFGNDAGETNTLWLCPDYITVV